VPSLAQVRAIMKKHPGMMFRVTMPFGVSTNDREDFGHMNIARL
jgi:hypothetical protein